MGADVGVLVRSLVVAVQVERTVVLILVVVTADVQGDTGSVVVAAVVTELEHPLVVWKSRLFIVAGRAHVGRGLTSPLFPHPSTPKRCALKVIFGDGSRCRRTGTKPGCCRPGRTHRSTDSGCSYRRRTGRHRKRCSSSGRRCTCYRQGCCQQC